MLLSWFVGCLIIILKLVYLMCSYGSHSHIRSTTKNPSFENPGISPSLMKGLGRKLADTCLLLSNHQQWRIPPLSHVINSQLLHILSNLLSSPSPVITSLRDGIIQECRQWLKRFQLFTINICTFVLLCPDIAPLCLEISSSDMKPGKLMKKHIIPWWLCVII